VLTPHLGYDVAETWAQFYPQSVENAPAFLDGKPIRVINPQVLGVAGRIVFSPLSHALTIDYRVGWVASNAKNFRLALCRQLAGS